VIYGASDGIDPLPNGGKRLNVMASSVGRVKVTPSGIPVTGVGRLRAAILNLGTYELKSRCATVPQPCIYERG
jgi:hypothetical protein